MELRRHAKKLPLIGPVLIQNEALLKTVAQQATFIAQAERSRALHAAAEEEAKRALMLSEASFAALEAEVQPLKDTSAQRAKRISELAAANGELSAKLQMALDRIETLANKTSPVAAKKVSAIVKPKLRGKK